MTAPDRLQELLSQNSVTGIDFVYVDDDEDQKTLDVFFFQHDNTLQAEDIVGTVALDQIRIYSPTGDEELPEVPVISADWVREENHVLRLTTAVPGDFSLYRMRIDHPKVDRYFNDVTFSFKANWPVIFTVIGGPYSTLPASATLIGKTGLKRIWALCWWK